MPGFSLSCSIFLWVDARYCYEYVKIATGKHVRDNRTKPPEQGCDEESTCLFQFGKHGVAEKGKMSESAIPDSAVFSIPTAFSMSFSDLDNFCEPIKDSVIIFCFSDFGGRSALLTKNLTDIGYEAYDLGGVADSSSYWARQADSLFRSNLNGARDYMTCGQLIQESPLPDREVYLSYRDEYLKLFADRQKNKKS